MIAERRQATFAVWISREAEYPPLLFDQDLIGVNLAPAILY